MILKTIEMEVVKKLSITDEDIEFSGVQYTVTISCTAEGTTIGCTNCTC
jgi:hypothetical protein